MSASFCVRGASGRYRCSRKTNKEACKAANDMARCFEQLQGVTRTRGAASQFRILNALCRTLTSRHIAPISDGGVYQLGWISRWLDRGDTSPLTNLPLEHKHIFHMSSLKAFVEQMLASCSSQQDALRARREVLMQQAIRRRPLRVV